MAFAELTNISSSLDRGLSGFQFEHDETVGWKFWDCEGSGGMGHGPQGPFRPYCVHCSLGTMLRAHSLQDKPFSNTQLTSFPWLTPSTPMLLLLCPQTHSSPTWLSFPIVFRENNPIFYQLSSRWCKFVSSLFSRWLVAPVALGQPEPSSAGGNRCAWSHLTSNSWLLLNPSQPHICLVHGHITCWFLCYSLTKILDVNPEQFP